MSDIFSIASIGLADARQRLETIGTNAANATRPGYRRQIATTRAFALEAAPSGAAAPSNDVREAGAAHVDLRAGQLVLTGRALDASIEGDELFFGLTDGQHVWLTRAGSFRIGSDGALVGERGLRVIGVSGDIRLESSDVEIAADGRILREGAAVGAIQLFHASDRTGVVAAGGTVLDAPDGVRAAEAGSGRLRGGALEASNAGGTQDMLDLVALTRQYESLIRVTQHCDELLGRTIQRLGEV